MYFRWLLTGMLVLGVPAAAAAAAAAADRYEGKYCAGAGDVEFLRLIDDRWRCSIRIPSCPAWR